MIGLALVRQAHVFGAIRQTIVGDDGAAEIKTVLVRITIGPFAIDVFQLDQLARALDRRVLWFRFGRRHHNQFRFRFSARWSRLG